MNKEPKSWEDLMYAVWDETHAVRVKQNEMPPDIPKWLCNSPLSLSTEADGCCDFFVKYGRWQTVDGDLRIMLFLRSLYAAEVLSSRKDRDYKWIGNGEEVRYFERLMTSCWYHDWHGWAQLHFSAKEWNFPFDPWP